MGEHQTKLDVRVQPNAGHNEVTGFREGVLHVKIAAPPVRGRANQELIKYLSSILGIARKRITIQKGITGRKKLVNIEGLDKDSITGIIKGLFS